MSTFTFILAGGPGCLSVCERHRYLQKSGAHAPLFLSLKRKKAGSWHKPWARTMERALTDPQGRETNNRSAQRLSLKERLALIGLIDEGMRRGSPESPVMADLFNDLWKLVDRTVSGSRISRLKPENSLNGFRMFEIRAETGESLGRLNMLYLKKPLPCYYLVYVEVAAPFRRKGLGNRILEYFRDFLTQRSAIGILDNIIPATDPTYHIYFKQAWEPVESIIGEGILRKEDHYMIYIPPALQGKDLRGPLVKLVYHLKRKREAIDMRDNEMMVQRTIAEFKELYNALLTYFEAEIEKEDPSPLMRFMFTRFVTKLISFRRRIADLIGYTGGDSMEQIVLHPKVSRLPVQSYAPDGLAENQTVVEGKKGLYGQLPEELKRHAARFIEALPNYERPSLLAWCKEKGLSPGKSLTLGDLMDLGFDPTRLKEIVIDGEAFIFERIQVRQLPELRKKALLLMKAEAALSGVRANNTPIGINPPLLVIRDMGNAYVLRRKIEGIHWDEALEQLLTAPSLKPLNATIGLDRIVKLTVKQALKNVAHALDLQEETLLDQLTCFVSWNLGANQPKLLVHFDGAFLESLWLA